jgi:hypothetical protein
VGTAPGGANLYAKSQGLNLAATVNTLPGGGVPIYVRLMTRFGSTWQYTNYTFTSGTAQAVLTSPTQGSALNGLAATFQWSAGVGATEYLLWVGTAPGQHDLYNESLGLNQFAFVNNLPGGSAPIFVRLRTRFESGEQFTDYEFTGAPFCN